jgi:hypothetical protein
MSGIEGAAPIRIFVKELPHFPIKLSSFPIRLESGTAIAVCPGICPLAEEIRSYDSFIEAFHRTQFFRNQDQVFSRVFSLGPNPGRYGYFFFAIRDNLAHSIQVDLRPENDTVTSTARPFAPRVSIPIPEDFLPPREIKFSNALNLRATLQFLDSGAVLTLVDSGERVRQAWHPRPSNNLELTELFMFPLDPNVLEQNPRFKVVSAAKLHSLVFSGVPSEPSVSLFRLHYSETSYWDIEKRETPNGFIAIITGGCSPDGGPEVLALKEGIKCLWRDPKGLPSSIQVFLQQDPMLMISHPGLCAARSVLAYPITCAGFLSQCHKQDDAFHARWNGLVKLVMGIPSVVQYLLMQNLDSVRRALSSDCILNLKDDVLRAYCMCGCKSIVCGGGVSAGFGKNKLAKLFNVMNALGKNLEDEVCAFKTELLEKHLISSTAIAEDRIIYLQENHVLEQARTDLFSQNHMFLSSISMSFSLAQEVAPDLIGDLESPQYRVSFSTIAAMFAHNNEGHEHFVPAGHFTWRSAFVLKDGACLLSVCIKLLMKMIQQNELVAGFPLGPIHFCIPLKLPSVREQREIGIASIKTMSGEAATHLLCIVEGMNNEESIPRLMTAYPESQNELRQRRASAWQ